MHIALYLICNTARTQGFQATLCPAGHTDSTDCFFFHIASCCCLFHSYGMHTYTRISTRCKKQHDSSDKHIVFCCSIVHLYSAYCNAHQSNFTYISHSHNIFFRVLTMCSLGGVTVQRGLVHLFVVNTLRFLTIRAPHRIQ